MKKNILIGLVLLGPAGASALQGPSSQLGGPRLVDEFAGPGWQNLSLHPFSQGLALSPATPISLEQVVLWLKQVINSPFARVDSTARLQLGDTWSGSEFSIKAYGLEICQASARLSRSPQGETLVFASLPKLNPSLPPPSLNKADWPSLDQSLDSALAQLQKQGRIAHRADIRVTAESPCLAVRHSGAQVALRINFQVDGLGWTAVAANETVFHLEPRFFDVADGLGTVHHENILDNNLEDVPLTDLDESGYLSTEYLITEMPAPFANAHAPDLVFQYDAVSDYRYDEVAAFYYVQRHQEFLESLGFEWYGLKPLYLQLHVKPGGQINNALFYPGDEQSGDHHTIMVHDGDGIDLQNLIRDADVVAHEFSHFVVYRTLRATIGQSLALHEGLADFFTFLRSGDACLGESICPVDSRACMIKARCLRTGDSDLLKLSYEDKQWLEWTRRFGELGHLHGQLVSGLLWDIRRSGRYTDAQLGSLVMQGIAYFKRDSGFRDLILALLMADRALFDGKNLQAIYDAAVQRGFMPLISDIQLASAMATEGGGAVNPSVETTGPASGGASNLPSTSNGNTPPSDDGKKKDEGDDKFGCGVLGQRGRTPFLFLILALPLLSLGVPTFSGYRPTACRRHETR